MATVGTVNTGSPNSAAESIKAVPLPVLQQWAALNTQITIHDPTSGSTGTGTAGHPIIA